MNTNTLFRYAQIILSEQIQQHLNHCSNKQDNALLMMYGCYFYLDPVWILARHVSQAQTNGCVEVWDRFKSACSVLSVF